MKLPIISLAILGGQALLAAQAGSIGPALDNFQAYYTGFSFTQGNFQPQRLLVGYGPWLVKRFVLPIARPRIGGMKLPVSLS